MSTPLKTAAERLIAKAQAHPNYNADDFAYLQAKGWTVEEIIARWNQEAGPCRWDTPTAKAKLQAVQRTSKTASAAYAEEQQRIATALESLQAKLKAHAAKAGTDPRNWGFAGDLAHVRELIEQAENFLGN